MMKEMQFFSRFEAVEQKTVLCAICQATNAVKEPIIKFSKITYKMPKKKKNTILSSNYYSTYSKAKLYNEMINCKKKIL